MAYPRFHSRLNKGGPTGIALLLVVVVLAALLSVSLSIFDVVFGETKISGEMTDSFKAIFAADQGMERMLYCDRTTPSANCDNLGQPAGCLGQPGQCSYPGPNLNDTQQLPTFSSGACAYVRLFRNASGDTKAFSTGEYVCGAAERSVRRALQSTYQR